MFIYSFKNIERKFIGHLMKKGHFGVAFKIWCDSLKIIRRKIPRVLPIDQFFAYALNNISPAVILVKRKRAGTIYNIPYLVQNKIKDDRAMLIAIRWIIKAARLRVGNFFSAKLAKELLDAFYKKGSCWKQKRDIYENAIKNRIYIKYLFAKNRRYRQFSFRRR